VRVTATEERLAVVLGQQLAGTLAGRIELNLPVIDKPASAEASKLKRIDNEFKPAPGSHPPKGTWTITVSSRWPTSPAAPPASSGSRSTSS
jgi:flagellar motor switch protein FliM